MLLGQDDLASAIIVSDNPGAIEVWVSCVLYPWKNVTIPRAIRVPERRETLASIFGIPADILHLHHGTKIIAGDRSANLLQEDLIHV